jgi:hypothetical protein|nr:MAG TPA: tail tape measure protein [Caudoviricetes sp.]
MKPVEIEFLIKNGTKATLEQITTDLNQVGRDGSQSIGATSTALEDAQRQALILCSVMEQLEGKIKELQSNPADLDQTENIAQIDALQKKVEELKLHIKQLEEVSEDTQVLPPSMPMAKRQFDGLHFSIQQMAREMPTLAMGPQMFFLAISNNLPIFSDELARARREYAELIKAGQKGTPVWKQVVKSLLSWQTAMTTGIMLLVMYGNEIVKSISDMTGWGAAKRAMREEIEKSIEIEKEAIGVAAKTRFELIQTMNSLRTFNGTKDEERQKIDELNRKYGESFGYYQTLAGWYDTLTLKAEEYTQMMFLQAKQQSLLSKSIEAEQQIEAIRKKGKEEYRPFWGDGGKANMFLGGDNLNQYGSDPAELAWKKEMAKLEEERDTYLSDMEFFRQREIEIAKDNSLDQVIAGSVTDLENSIAIRRKALGDITNKEEYDKALADIEALEARVRSITGAKDPKSDKAAQAQKEYENARLSSIKDAKEAELELERSAIKDKIKLIEFERDARIKAIQEEKAAYQKKYGKNADTSGFDREITAVGKQADADIGEQNKEDIKARLVAMQEYLKEYGTFQQKKYAVAQEYALKIKEAQTDGERLSLEKELASYNSNLQVEDLKMNIDWGTVFGEFGGMFSEMIKPALEDAKKYLQTDQFKNSDEASKQALIEAIAKMEKALGSSGTLNFKKLGEDMQVYQNTLIALNETKQQEIEAIEKLNAAQKQYEEALKGGSQTEIEAAEANLTSAQDNADAASTAVQTLTTTANQAQQTVTDTATALKASMDNVTQGLSKIASGSLTGAYEGLLQVSKGVGGIMEKFADKLESVPIIGWIVSIIDLFKDGLSLVVGGLLDAIFNAVSGIISDILSGDLFITIGESILKGVVNIVKSIVTLGGALTFWGKESDPELQEDIDRLTASNERLEQALNRLSDKMDDAATSEAASVYKEQLDNVNSREQNTNEMMRREAGAWTNWGYGFLGMGGKSSSNKYINDNISGSEWSEISKVVGRNISNAGDFWGLSSEEMAKVAEEAGWIYDKIKGYADDGHKNAAQYMDQYIAYAKEREELEKAYYEKLTATSFDSVRDEFKNTLLDMESDTEDFANNFEKMMQNAIIESMMTEKYDKKLKEWYKSFGKAMEDGDMSKSEKDALQNDYNNIVNDALKERDALKDIFGWDSEDATSQKGRSGSFETMSQDQGNKLEGLFTANEMRTARIEETVERVDMQMSIAVGHLEKIEENTGRSADSLDDLVEEIRAMIRDGLKVK